MIGVAPRRKEIFPIGKISNLKGRARCFWSFLLKNAVRSDTVGPIRQGGLMTPPGQSWRP